MQWHFPTSVITFQVHSNLRTAARTFQLGSILSNFIVFNFKLYNYTYPDFVYENCETSTVQISVEHHSLLDSVLVRFKFLPNFTSILPWIRAKMDKTMDTTWKSIFQLTNLGGIIFFKIFSFFGDSIWDMLLLAVREDSNMRLENSYFKVCYAPESLYAWLNDFVTSATVIAYL